MKILHTADWHLGQSLYGFDRLDEQRRFLGQLCEVVAEERPDAMVVAGDVFDISMPSAAAQRVYAEGLLAIHAAVPEMVIVIVAGNHDSASRLEIYRTFGGRTTCLSSALCAVLQTIAPTIQRMSSPCLAKAI